MSQQIVLRGKVSAYPSDDDKGLVEVKIGAYDAQNDTVLARAEQSMSGVYWLPELGDVVEVALPQLPGYEARIIQIHRQAQDQQINNCWTQNNDKKQFRTRSGHTFTLDDTQDNTRVSLRTASGLELAMEDQGQTITLRTDQKEEPVFLLDMKNDEIKLAAVQKMTLSCGGASIAFDGDGNITITAKGKLQLSGQEICEEAENKLVSKAQQVELTGTMSAALSGENQMQVSSSGITQVKGKTVKLN